MLSSKINTTAIARAAVAALSATGVTSLAYVVNQPGVGGDVSSFNNESRPEALEVQPPREMEEEYAEQAA
jgi:hypothetical protein